MNLYYLKRPAKQQNHKRLSQSLKKKNKSDTEPETESEISEITEITENPKRKHQKEKRQEIKLPIQQALLRFY